MDTLIEEGGATPHESNSYHFVAVPKTRQCGSRRPITWTLVD
ncbi:MAG: hypothetical protein AB9866_02940 [Syntrophobacteraceae bacterium]